MIVKVAAPATPATGVAVDGQQFAALLKRLEAATVKLEGLTVAPVGVGMAPAQAVAPAVSADIESPSLEAFDELVSGPLANFLALSASIGGVVAEQAQAFNAAFLAERDLLATAARCKKPADATALQALLKPISTQMEVVTQLREKSRSSPLFHHLSTVSEGTPALGWVAVEPKPAPFVGEMKEASQFYANRVIKERKDTDKMHVEWASAFTGLLVDLQAFVKKFHTTGLVWNANGEVAKPGATGAPAAAKSGAPPPPGPPPPPMTDFSTGEAAAAPALSSVFGELNKGENVTAGLRKVDKSEMTHKNPALRASSVVPSKAPSSNSTTTTAPSATAVKAPPKFGLEGNKWVVENQVDNKSIVIEETELRQVVYIFGCTGSVVQVKGKVNAVVMDSCKKCAVVVESVVSSLDIVNCKSAQAQILGKAPTTVIDKTDGLVLFLSRECLDIEIFTAKSSELNVSTPGKTDNDDYVERALPEQLKTTIDAKTGAMSTVVVEHKG